MSILSPDLLLRWAAPLSLLSQYPSRLFPCVTLPRRFVNWDRSAAQQLRHPPTLFLVLHFRNCRDLTCPAAAGGTSASDSAIAIPQPRNRLHLPAAAAAAAAGTCSQGDSPLPPTYTQLHLLRLLVMNFFLSAECGQQACPTVLAPAPYRPGYRPGTCSV